MKKSQAWFIASQAWLAASVVAPDGWQTAVCVMFGAVWYCGSLILDRREWNRG